ncbi:zinc transporter ZIP3-like [Periplaneta americana]|uniref:zinc transporter ZIP3-like n=1 Tax=Periplaneta americana TaxID=6978 RepID=UPI0037E919A3
MALVLYKILTLLALAIFSLLCGLLPYPIISYFKTHGSFRSRRVTSFISAVICFSGGTLLGIAFLHLMPDMRQKLAALPKTGINSNPDIPVSDILTCGGFFFVYLLDELMHILVERCVGRKSVPVTVLSRRSRAAAASTSLQENINSQSSGMMGLFSLDTHVSSHHRKFLDTHPIHYEATHRDAHLHHMVPNGEVELESTDLAKDESAQNDATSAHENDCEAQEEGTPEQHRVYAVLPAVSGLITILALSFHDVFEGLAIGVESRERDVLFMYLSVAVHKYAIAFCIGLDLVLAGTKMAVIFIYILTYSAVTPIGTYYNFTIQISVRNMYDKKLSCVKYY